MTFSIVARCPTTGALGVAAVTAVPAVGKLLTWAHPRTCAIATQAHINPYLGIDARRAMKQGQSADEAAERVLAADPDRSLRQLAIVDGEGRVAVFTGERCSPWRGHRAFEGFSVQGNLLVSGATLDAMADAFLAWPERELAERLLVALEAGAAAGGDRRGCTSATIYVVDREEYPLWDVRVDDHPRAMDELRRLFLVFRERVVPEVRRLPKREDPRGDPEAERGTGLA